MDEASEGEVASGAASVLTAAEDCASILQEAPDETDAFSAGDTIWTEDEGEEDRREATVGLTGRAIEISVPM